MIRKETLNEILLEELVRFLGVVDAIALELHACCLPGLHIVLGCRFRQFLDERSALLFFCEILLKLPDQRVDYSMSVPPEY